MMLHTVILFLHVFIIFCKASCYINAYRSALDDGHIYNRAQ